MKKPIVSLCLLLLLAACQSEQHYAIEAPPSFPVTTPPPTQRGTAQPPRVKPSMPNYAGTAGPLTQAGVGRYMDGMEQDLRRILRGTPVARPGDTLALELHGDALFEKGSVLSDDGRELLGALAAALRHYDRTTIRVNGYTDTRGTPDQAIKTTQKRADAVAAELRADGVDPRRIAATGLGSARLKKATGDGVSEPRNRRIEIRIVPKPG